jgi:hypothetical protein
MMNKITTIVGLLSCLGLLAAPAMAGNFDGSKTVICAAVDVVECLPGGECSRMGADEIAFPDFVRINFEKKEIRTQQSGHEKRKTNIERMESVGGKLIIQGAENAREGATDSLGWSMTIDEENGKMVLSAAGTDAAFVVFGACTLP